MGIFDKLKKKEDTSNTMYYDEALESYVIEIKNIKFINEEEQNNEYINNLSKIADNYHKNLNNIIEFMLPDLKAMYGEIDKKSIIEKLGWPIIDYDNGIVKYLEQSFDNLHIFSFEFLDDEFKDIQYFSIDG
ncbi:MAG: hypothetical protein Q4C21_04620 [Oscillospiraceae bacterium]|nr:hypothetical protein [Oscillospiraceae bacterium]